MKYPRPVLLISALALISCWAGVAAESEISLDLKEVVASAENYESGQGNEAFRRIEAAVRQAAGNPGLRHQVEAQLLPLLAPEASFEARKFACEQLAIIGSQAALPALSRLLEDEQTASIACLALSTFPQGKADTILRDALAWSKGKARIQVINLLGNRRDPKAVGVLSKTATSSEKEIAEAAIAALGKIQTPASWKAIVELEGRVQVPSPAVMDEAKLRAAEGMLAAGNRKRAKSLYEDLLAGSEKTAVRRSALARLLTLDADGGEERILETLSGPDTALRPVALAAVSGVPSPGASDNFARQLHHLKPEEQAMLIESLALRNDDAARLALAKALSSPEPLARRAAIAALARLGEPYFASLLARSASLASDAEENRALESALVALKGGAETDQRLVAELKTSSPKPRVLLIGAVTRRQGAAANPLLLEETSNTDPAVAKAAFRAIAKSGTASDAAPLLAKLTTVLEPSVRTEGESAAAQVLKKVDDPGQRSSLVRQLLAKATTIPCRLSFISLLPVCGDAEALTELKGAAADPEPEVREAAVRALTEWPDPAATEILLALYRKPDKGNLHGLALRGLVRLVTEQNAHPDQQVLLRYRALIAGARDASELKLILSALGGYGQPEALALALPLLSDPAVRPEAIVAVRRIAEASKAQNPGLAEEALKRLPNP